MTAAAAIAQIATLFGLNDASPEDVVAHVTEYRDRAVETSADYSGTLNRLERAKPALERAARDMDAVALELNKRRNRAGSSQAYADMTDLAGRLTLNAADARNVAGLV